MPNNHLISVIIPVYNGEKFIEGALENIKKQKLDIPLEIIFVDNNSKDHSFEVINNVALKEKNIKVFKELKKGAAAARNKGFNQSKGDYIYFYDVDDYLFEDTIISLLNALKSYPEAQAAFGKMMKVSLEELKNNTIFESNNNYNQRFYNPPYWGMAWHKDLTKVVGPPAFLYKREVFSKIGLYEENLLTGQDTALDIKLGMSLPVVQLDRCVYAYVKHNNSTTQKTKKKESVERMQWPRLTQSHLPFYLNNQKTLPLEFYQVLEKRIFSNMGKIIKQTNRIGDRLRIKLKLEKDIKPVKLPFVINLYLLLLIIIPASIILKFYLYYLLPNFSSTFYKN